jgi:hypothetical protein
MSASAIDINSFFPEVFSIEDIRCSSGKVGGYDYRATLCHDRATVTVSFNRAHRDARLRKGSFVSVNWLPAACCDHGAVKVGGLALRKWTANGFNPFMSVPHNWGTGRRQIECARDLWDASSRQLRKLLFDNFWNSLLPKRAIAKGRMN